MIETILEFQKLQRQMPQVMADSKFKASYFIEAIKIRMEELNIKQKDLVGIIGAKSRVSEILNRKKKLTVDMIRDLEHRLQIPASVLVSSYPLQNSVEKQLD